MDQDTKETLDRLSRTGGKSLTGSEKGDAEAREMAANRRVAMKKQGAISSGGGHPTTQFATQRPRDPMFYWKQNNLPYDYSESENLQKIREYTQLLYGSHSVVGSCVDIYSKYPTLGASLTCRNDDLTQFYTDLFFSEDGLDYENFFVDIGVSYWTLGEAFPLGSFNEKLGVWESDELIHPNDVEVTRSPFMKEPRFAMRLPDTIRRILTERNPAWEFSRLINEYPELIRYLGQEDFVPVSNVLMRQLRFKGDLFHSRGIPLLMRAMRPIMQEEMLNAAMDAVADRLYTPLIHAKIGASATDLGVGQPWIPTQDDLSEFNSQLDLAMAGDFRVMATNFAVQMESLFGRESQPDFGPDFERIEGRILQAFGLSKTLLSGAGQGETYAADALNKQLVSQLLGTYQRLLANHYRQRALVVAEAQEHYDYEERNGKRYIKMEEVLEVDEETGEERIVEQPKLLIPDIVFRTMDLSDEETHRQFFEQLRSSGVPISIKTRMMNIPFSLDDEIEQSRKESVDLAVAEQETRREQYRSLREAGLPIPQDLRDDFEPKANQVPAGAAEGQRTPLLGLDSTTDSPNLAPTQQDQMVDQAAGAVIPGQPGVAVDPVAAMAMQQAAAQAMAPPSNVPPESNEMRADMPKQSSLWRGARNMRELVNEHWQPEPETLNVPGKDGEETTISNDAPRGLFGPPKHVGMRRHATVAPEEILREDKDES